MSTPLTSASVASHESIDRPVDPFGRPTGHEDHEDRERRARRTDRLGLLAAFLTDTPVPAGLAASRRAAEGDDTDPLATLAGAMVALRPFPVTDRTGAEVDGAGAEEIEVDLTEAPAADGVEADTTADPASPLVAA